MDFNEIAKQIAVDMADRERRLRDLNVEAGKLQLQIDKSYDEREAAKAETERVKSECDAKIGFYRRGVEQAQSDLAVITAQVQAQRAAFATDKDAHRGDLAQLKADYAAAARSLRDDINQLVKRRDEMEADKKRFLEKWSNK